MSVFRMTSFKKRIFISMALMSVAISGTLFWMLKNHDRRRYQQSFLKDLSVLLKQKDFQHNTNDSADVLTLRKKDGHFQKSVNDTKENMLNESQAQWTKFPYPLDINMVELVRKLRANLSVDHKPIFPYQYEFAYHSVDSCVNSSPFFIFLIKSSVQNHQYRSTIRETWANSKLMHKYNFERMFLVGNSKKENTQAALENENDMYKDMILMSFFDNYFNNTLKTIGSIHWTAKHCNRSKFVVFVDDDVLVSTSRLVEFLKHKVTSPIFFGGFIQTHKPVRNVKVKWYVSPNDYPHEEYPPMPSGGFMIMTMEFVIDLHFASQYTKKFILDDCYLGILAYKLQVSPVYIGSVYMTRVRMGSRVFNTSMIANHHYSASSMKTAWLYLQKVEQEVSDSS
ncbi:beta-1,3-galactosyltransferase 1-like [Ylistrum balloti]|uniref:beta-1,3-galactosyltransferase 1-like n=1 Tax=Ylistrum balloti TaxID=509963 RepID=UPI002905EB65|nr:beta-1,3-galactosyltransferase 1-like [Ylistrum balloti]